MVAPWAVLGHVICQVLVRVPFTVVLPPLIGGYASLNFILATVAGSGAGKGAAKSAAASLVEWRGASPGVFPHDLPLGTGEGITATYRQYVSPKKDGDDGGGWEWVYPSHAASFTTDEIDVLTAQANRQGATIMPVLRSAWSGETLGSTTAARERRIQVDPLAYRFVATLGVQPSRGHGLLRDASGGTPQRFLWLPATDPGLPGWRTRPGYPGRLVVTLPPWPEHTGQADGFNVVTVADPVAAEILDTHVANQRGERDTLDGHAMLAREKVAYALAVLNGHYDLTAEDWELAGMVMAVSDHTRAWMAATAETEHARQAKEFLARKVAAQDEVNEARDQALITKYKAWVVDLVKAGPVTANQVKHMKTNKYREQVETAITELVASGNLMEDDQGYLFFPR
jgi:hypothetical protein